MMRAPIARPGAAFSRFAACRRGSAALEMAIVLPVLCLMIVGTIYSGWVIYSTNMLYFAVESAARCAAVNTTLCGPGPSGTAQIPNIQAFAVSQAWGINVVAANFTVTQPTCGWRVTANYTFLFVMPFQADFNVLISPSACYPAQSS